MAVVVMIGILTALSTFVPVIDASKKVIDNYLGLSLVYSGF